MARWDIAIKMGTSTTSIFLSGNGIVLSEPTLIAFSGEAKNRRIRAVGKQAFNMLGKAPDSTTIVSPVVDGVIADRNLASLLLLEFLDMIIPSDTIFRPKINVIMAVPTGLSVAERRMYEDVCFRAGAHSVTLMDNIMLAAIGIDLPVEASIGRLIVNLGAGITEVAVVNLCTVVTGCSINLGGNMIDRALMDCVAGKYNLRISASAAKKIKDEIGSVYPNDITEINVTGLDLINNSLAYANVTAADVRETALPYYTRICEAIEGVINVCPTDIAADINRTGVYLTGGGSKMSGLDRLLTSRLNLSVNTFEEPEYAIIAGAGKLLSSNGLLNEILRQR